MKVVLKRIGYSLTVALVITGCGVNGHSHGKWPAAVVQTENLTEMQKDLVFETLKDLNTQIRRTVVNPEQAGDAYPITIKLHGKWAEAPSRAGYATVADDRCLVELSDEIFQDDKKDFLKPVIWHEFGHCAGLNHDPREGEIMYRTSSTMQDYQAPAINRFFSAILSSAGL